MNQTSNQPQIRLFISSTFADLHEERDYLTRRIFPRIAEICRERGILFTHVDLRWGITEKDAKKGKTLRLCLEEIEKCKPYFIGILGHRYGWIPEEKDILKDPMLNKQYATEIEAFKEEKISITEMEILRGVFKEDSMNARFYFEDDDYYAVKQQKPGYENIEEEEPYKKKKLQQLKEKVKEKGLAHDHPFTSIEELGEFVYNDFVALIDREYPQKPTLTESQLKYRRHLEFAATRKEFYYVKPEEYREFSESVENGNQPLLLFGKSGVGKTALLANWADRYRMDHPNVEVIEYYSGAAKEMTDTEIMVHLLNRIKEVDNRIKDEMVVNLTGKHNEFSAILKKTEKKLLIIIDGINQLSMKYQSLHWIPAVLPENITLMISTIDQEPYKARSWKTMEIKPLSIKQTEEFIREYLHSHSKKIEKGLFEKITRYNQGSIGEKLKYIIGKSLDRGAEKIGNPLFMKTFLNELIITGRHENLYDRGEYYLESRDTEGLFEKVLSRIEEDYGKSIVRFLFGSMLFSRNGLTEDELVLLSGDQGYKTIDVLDCLRDLEFHITRKSQYIDFFHDFVRQAVKVKYFDKSGEREIRITLLEFFRHPDNNDTKRRMYEVPYQLYQLEKRDELEAFIFAKGRETDKTNFEYFSRNHIYELIVYFQFLSEKKHRVFEELIGRLEIKTQRMDHKENDAKMNGEKVRLIENVLNFLELYEEHDKALQVAEYLYFNIEREHGADHERTKAMYSQYLSLLLKTGQHEEALTLTKKKLERAEESGSPIDIARAYHNLGFVEIYNEQLPEEINNLMKSLEIKKSLYGNVHAELVDTLDVIGSYYSWYGDEDERAAITLKESLEIKRQLFGVNDLSIAYSYILLTLCDTAGLQGDKAKLRYLEKALMIREHHYGINHPKVAEVLLQISMIAEDKQGKNDARKAWSIFKSFYGLHHPKTIAAAKWLIFLLGFSVSHGDLSEVRYIKNLMEFDENNGVEGHEGPDGQERPVKDQSTSDDEKFYNTLTKERDLYAKIKKSTFSHPLSTILLLLAPGVFMVFLPYESIGLHTHFTFGVIAIISLIYGYWRKYENEAVVIGFYLIPVVIYGVYSLTGRLDNLFTRTVTSLYTGIFDENLYMIATHLLSLEEIINTPYYFDGNISLLGLTGMRVVAGICFYIGGVKLSKRIKKN